MKNIYIEYLEGKDGNQQVVDMISEIITESESTDADNKDYDQLRQRITHGLYYIGEVGITKEKLEEVIGHTDEGHVFTLTRLVKPLINHPPLYEFRVNWRPIGAFRAIFFYEEDTKGDQHIYFTKAVIKSHTFSQEFEDIVAESEIMLRDFKNL